MFSSKIQHLFFVSTAQFSYKNPSKSNIQQTLTQTYELGQMIEYLDSRTTLL